jgi:hypothetical protein
MFSQKITSLPAECLALGRAHSYALVIRFASYALDLHAANRDGLARLQRTDTVP